MDSPETIESSADSSVRPITIGSSSSSQLIVASSSSSASPSASPAAITVTESSGSTSTSPAPAAVAMHTIASSDEGDHDPPGADHDADDDRRSDTIEHVEPSSDEPEVLEAESMAAQLAAKAAEARLRLLRARRTSAQVSQASAHSARSTASRQRPAWPPNESPQRLPDGRDRAIAALRRSEMREYCRDAFADPITLPVFKMDILKFQFVLKYLLALKSQFVPKYLITL